MTLTLNQRALAVNGLRVLLDDQLGHLMVEHDGSVTWDQLQAVKSAVWGPEARAIEVYPSQSDVVNTGCYRHLWRLGEGDFCPDLLHHRDQHLFDPDALEARHFMAWREADGVFR